MQGANVARAGRQRNIMPLINTHASQLHWRTERWATHADAGIHVMSTSVRSLA